MLTRRQTLSAAGLSALSLAAPSLVRAQDLPKITLAMSGWTGFAPLTLAEKAGLFKKNGVDVEVKFIAQKDRHLAVAAGQVQAVATTLDTYVSYTAAGVPLAIVALLDKSKGGDGLVVRNEIADIKALKDKTIACDGAGTTPYFMLMCMLKKNGMTAKDVKLSVLGPQPAANAFVAGQFDAAVTYEPYLSTIRAEPKAGKILATTLDYPVVVDALAFGPDFIAKNPKIVEGAVKGYFDALDMIKSEPDKAYEIMGAKVNQSGEQFGKSAAFIEWQDRAANKAYFDKDMMEFLKFATDIQLEAGVVRQAPDLKTLVDGRFLG